jgi:gliding motility-associated-like protein
MKYSTILVLLSLFLLSSCVEKDEIYPRPKETIYIKVDHDTIISMYDNQTYILNAETGDSASIYNWNYTNLNTPSITVERPWYIYVDITTNTINQHFSVTLNYGENTMYYPSSFTPNGDGENDCWSPQGINIDPDRLLIKIYDKNDHLLYKADQLYQPWNGAIDGAPCPIGYYYYVVKYKTLNGEKHKDSGMLQLIR